MLNNLTINIKKDNTLNKLILNELVDPSVLNLLINSSLIKKNDDYDEKIQLLGYRKLIKNNKVSVLYERKKNIGRYIPKKGLGYANISKETRHSLCVDNYIDIDIVNCHPTILYQILTKNSIRCNNLKKYIDDRNIHLDYVINKYKCTEKQAKKLFIRILYLGSFDNWLIEEKIEVKDKSDFIQNLEKELNQISYLIMNSNKELLDFIDKDKTNKKGTITSYFLQEIESQILEQIYLYCKEKKYIINDVCSLCYDGIMLEKKYYNDSLINELNELIKSKFDLDLKFKEKHMNEGYTIDHIKSTLEFVDDYEEKKYTFEQTKFKLMNPLNYIENKDDELIFRSKNEFRMAYENYYYLKTSFDKDGNLISNKKIFVDAWYGDEKIRTYDKIDFLPMQIAPDNIYNTFTGYEIDKVTTYNTIDIKTTNLYKHLDNLCGNDSNVLTYVINFLSRKLRQPYKNTNTALIFKSVQGVGKDLFFNWFGNKIIGNKYYFNDVNTDTIFGTFNSNLENKIMIVINETSISSTKDQIELIKGCITADKFNINKKGLKSYENKNNTCFIFLTNNKNPIKIDVDDRRFVGIECNNTYANNNEYIKNLINDINDENITRSFYDLLINNIDSDNYDFTLNRPITSFYTDCREINIPILYKFLENEIINNLHINVTNKKYTNLFNTFLEYVKSQNCKYEITSTRFGLDIKEFEAIDKKRNNKGVVYIIDFEKLKEYMISKKYMNNYDQNLFIEDDTHISFQNDLDI